MDWFAQLSTADYVILAILLGATLVGWVRGLIEILTGFLVFIVTMVAAGRYSGQVVSWLNRQFKAKEWLTDLLERRLALPDEAFSTPASSIPWDKAMELLANIPLPQAYREVLAGQIAEWSTMAAGQTTATFIISTLASAVLHAVAFVALLVVIGGLLSLVGRLVNQQVKEIPLVGTTNRILGAGVMLGETVVVLALFVGLLLPVFSMYGFKAPGAALEGAEVTPYLLQVFEWLRALLFGAAGVYFPGGGSA